MPVPHDLHRYMHDLADALDARGVAPAERAAILTGVRAHVGATASHPVRSLGPAREFARQFGSRRRRSR